MEEENKPKLQINWLQAAGASLGATSSAVLLSTIGAAGTIIGAALGSLCVTIGGAVYTHSLQVSRRRVAKAQAAALTKLHQSRMAHTHAHAAVGGYHLSSTQIDLEPVPLDQAAKAEDAGGGREPWRDVVAALPWKRIALVSLGLFLVVMVIITTFELATGRSVSSYTGGSSKTGSRTSIPGLGGGGSSTGPQPSPTPGNQASPGRGQATGQGTPTSGSTAQSTPTPGSGPSQQGSSAPATPTPTSAPTAGSTPTHTTSPQAQPTPTGSAQPQ